MILFQIQIQSLVVFLPYKKSIAFGFYLVNTDGLPTRDGQLHVQQEPDAVLDSTTQQWSLVLSCGIFVYLAEPAFPVEWLVGALCLFLYFHWMKTFCLLKNNTKKTIFTD